MVKIRSVADNGSETLHLILNPKSRKRTLRQGDWWGHQTRSLVFFFILFILTNFFYLISIGQTFLSNKIRVNTIELLIEKENIRNKLKKEIKLIDNFSIEEKNFITIINVFKTKRNNFKLTDVFSLTKRNRASEKRNIKILDNFLEKYFKLLSDENLFIKYFFYDSGSIYELTTNLGIKSNRYLDSIQYNNLFLTGLDINFDYDYKCGKTRSLFVEEIPLQYYDDIKFSIINNIKRNEGFVFQRVTTPLENFFPPVPFGTKVKGLEFDTIIRKFEILKDIDTRKIILGSSLDIDINIEKTNKIDELIICKTFIISDEKIVGIDNSSAPIIAKIKGKTYIFKLLKRVIKHFDCSIVDFPDFDIIGIKESVNEKRRIQILDSFMKYIEIKIKEINEENISVKRNGLFISFTSNPIKIDRLSKYDYFRLTGKIILRERFVNRQKISYMDSDFRDKKCVGLVGSGYIYRLSLNRVLEKSIHKNHIFELCSISIFDNFDELITKLIIDQISKYCINFGGCTNNDNFFIFSK